MNKIQIPLGIAALAAISVLLPIGGSPPDTSGRRKEVSGPFKSEDWLVVSGDWRFEDGNVVGRSAPAECAVLRLRRSVRDVKELQVDAELLENVGEGVHIEFGGQAFYHYATGWTGIYPPYEQRWDTPLVAGRTVRIVLRRTRDRYELHVDGRLLASKCGAPADSLPTDRIALYAVRGAGVRYSNLRVR